MSKPYWRRASPLKTRYEATYAWFSKDGVKRFVGPMESTDEFKVLCRPRRHERSTARRARGGVQTRDGLSAVAVPKSAK